MDNSNSAAMIGYVLMSLASLVGLALGVKQLLKPNANGGSYGNGTHDVTRREFQEHKETTRLVSKEIEDQLKALEIEVAVLRESLRPRVFHPDEEHE